MTQKLITLILIFAYITPFSFVHSQTTGEQLPSWFFKPENYNRVNLAIGISDPNSDTTLAIEQAKINALINYSILHDGIFTTLTNVGMGGQQQDVGQSVNLEYILYTGIIKGKLIPFSAITVKEKHFTAYKEAVVLLEINNEKVTDTITPSFTIARRSGFQKEDNTFPLFADELDIVVVKGDSVLLSTGIEKEGLKFRNAKNDKNNRFYSNFGNSRMCFYQEGKYLGPKGQSIPSTLNYGIWKSYIFNLIDQISIYNSMDINCQYKLSTANIGNLNKSSQPLTFQQLVYSLKNVQAQKLNHSIESMDFTGNNLYLCLKSRNDLTSSFPQISTSKEEKKQLKKLKSQNWKFLGDDNFESAWQKALSIAKNKDAFLSTEIEIQANNLQSGIIEGIQLAKLELSSQLATKITALNKNDINSKDQVSVKSAKLINIEKTGKIEPYFIFYQNQTPGVYNIKMFLLYDLKQISGL